MNTSARILLSTLLLLGVSTISQAAPEVAPLPFGEPPALKGNIPLPPPTPIYEASMQTNQPAQALGKLIANVPQVADKNYEVRVMVRELPPKPPLPEHVSPEKAAK